MGITPADDPFERRDSSNCLSDNQQGGLPGPRSGDMEAASAGERVSPMSRAGSQARGSGDMGVASAGCQIGSNGGTCLQDSTVAIVGLGLMGGSLAGALRGQCRRVIGIARRPETLEEALRAGWIDWGTSSLKDGVSGADLTVLSVPVRAILDLVQRIGPWLPHDAVLLDLGSTKRQIVAALQSTPPHVQPLGGHPMCGRERSGLQAADPSLYRGARFVLTPLKRTSQQAIALAEALVRAVGATPVVLDAQRHDRIAAAVSHLPYLLAVALMGTAEDLSRRDEDLWSMTASGFRDMTRLAGSDVEMMLDILLTNRDPILESLGRFRDHLDALTAALRQRDEAQLAQWIRAARERRQEVCQ